MRRTRDHGVESVKCEAKDRSSPGSTDPAPPTVQVQGGGWAPYAIAIFGFMITGVFSCLGALRGAYRHLHTPLQSCHPIDGI